MKKLLIILCLLIMAGMIFFSTCGVYVHITHLTKDEEKWIGCAERWPFVDFISNRGDTARMSYPISYVSNSARPYTISVTGRWSFEAAAAYTMSIKSRSKTKPHRNELTGEFEVTVPVDSDSAVYTVRLGARDLDPQFDFKKLKKFKLDSITFNDCVVVDSANSCMIDLYERKYRRRYSPHFLNTADPDNHIETFVISKRYGLIYYKYKDGEEYTRKFR